MLTWYETATRGEYSADKDGVQYTITPYRKLVDDGSGDFLTGFCYLTVEYNGTRSRVLHSSISVAKSAATRKAKRRALIVASWEHRLTAADL